MKTKKTFIPIVTLCAALFLTACTGKGAATTESHRIPRRKPVQKPQGIPAQHWMIYISRKTRSLPIMRMYGTKCSA